MRVNNPISRILALILAFLMLLGLAVPAFALDSADRIEIHNAEDLMELARSCTLNTWSQGKTILLAADISLEGTSFTPIPTFGGTFDGNGHTISGLKITDSVVPSGLFGVLQEGAVIRNLTVSGTVTPTGDSDPVGGIVGENYGTLIGCSFSGTVSGEQNTGGIAGINASTGILINCTSSGAVTGSKMTGGIAGCNLGIIQSCVNNAYVNTSSVDPTLSPEDIHIDFTLDTTKITSLDTSTAAMDTGGIAGYSSGIIKNCVNTAIVGYPHIGYNVGGIAGRSCGYLYACQNTAEVYGRKDVGGIAGQLEPYIVKNISESGLEKLERQLDALDEMLEKAINDCDEGMQAISARLNRIASAMDGAASAASDIRTYGSLSSTVSGSGESSADGSITVTPPQVEVEAGAGTVGGGAAVITPIGGAAGGGSVIAGEISGGLTEGGVSGEGSSAANGSIDASAQIMVTTSLSGLSSAIYSMAGQMRLLGGEMGDTSGVLSEDMQEIRSQISAISDTAFDLLLGDGEGDVLVDSSEIDVDLVTLGKASQCENSGSINGDINVGGITGVMAMEYELDPEDDVTVNLNSSQRRKYEVKAIAQDCVNRGPVTAKRNYAGGICGRMDLGLIAQCENYGTVESESGDYVGGIAGIAGSTVRHCFAKCTLSGDMYVGGIVGSGISSDRDGEASTIAGCYSLVDIPKYGQYAGAISGADAGNFTENYFVSPSLAGINRTSYSGQAEPISYEDLLLLFSRQEAQSALPAEQSAEPEAEEESYAEPENAAEDAGQSAEEESNSEPENEEILLPTIELPDEFRHFTLKFVADGIVIKSETFDYGASFDESVFPEIPEKDGYYANWDRTDLTNLQFDTVVSVVYTQYITAVPSTETRSEGRPVFFVEGLFDDGAVISATLQANTPSEFDDLPTGWWDLAVKCFTGTRVSREIVEQWNLSIPNDGYNSHTVRYLAPDEKPNNLNIYIKQGSSWKKVDSEAIGSYLTFTMEGESAQIAVISTIQTWWVWLITALLAVVLLILIIRLIRKVRRHRKHAAPPPTVPSGDSVPDTTESSSSSDSAVPAPAPRKRRWLVPLLIVLALLCGAGGTAAFFLLPDLTRDLKAYDLLKKCVEKQELTMALSVDAQVGSQELSFDADIDRTNLEGHRVTSILQENHRLFYADGVVFLENGKAYRLDDAFPDYSQLLNQTMQLYQHIDISAKGSVYTITAEKEDAKAILELLMPSVASTLLETNTITVELTETGGEASQIRFSGTGKLNDAEKTEFHLSAVLEIDALQQSRIYIPQDVKDAILNGSYTADNGLTDALFGLLDGWQDLNSRNPLAAKLTLKADCGPLVLNENLDLYRWTEDGRRISSIQKNGYALYFTDTAVCDKNGRALLSTEASNMEAAKLLDIAYQLCMSAELECRQSAGTDTYTLALDEDGIKAVAYAIAPAAEDMDILFDSGSLQIVMEGNKIQSVQVRCDGQMQVIFSDVAVSLEAQLHFSEDTVEMEIPEEVREALKK